MMNLFKFMLSNCILLIGFYAQCAQEQANNIVPAPITQVINQLRNWDIVHSRPDLVQWLAARYRQLHYVPISSEVLKHDSVYALKRDDGYIMLASGCRDRNIHLGKCGQRRQRNDRVFAWSRDGKLAYDDWRKIGLWDSNGNPIGSPLLGHGDRVTTLAWGPDGTRFTSGSNDKTICLWDSNGNPIGSPLLGHTDGVTALAWSPDGTRFASGSHDKTIRLWDSNGNPIGSPLLGHTDGVTALAWSPDGTRFASGSHDKTIRLWDSNGNPMSPPLLGHTGAVTTLAWSPDGTRFASGSNDKTIRLWGSNGDAMGSPLINDMDLFYEFGLAWSPDSTRLAGFHHAIARSLLEYGFSFARLWDRNGNPIGVPFKGRRGVTTIAWSPDSTRLAVGDYLDIYVLDQKGNQLGLPIKDVENALHALDWSPDGNMLASGSLCKPTICLWDMSIPEPLKKALNQLTIEQIIFLINVYPFLQHNQVFQLIGQASRDLYNSLPEVIRELIHQCVQAN